MPPELLPSTLRLRAVRRSPGTGARLLVLLVLLVATATSALLRLWQVASRLPLIILLRLHLVLVKLQRHNLLRYGCMSSSSPPACNQSRRLEPSNRKAVDGRLAEPHPQGSDPPARASTSLELDCSATTCHVRATVPTLSLQPKLWLTGAIVRERRSCSLKYPTLHLSDRSS